MAGRVPIVLGCRKTSYTFRSSSVNRLSHTGMTLPPVYDKSLAFSPVLLRAIIPFLLVNAIRFHEGRASSMGSRALSCGVTCRSLVVTPVTPQTRGREAPAGTVRGLGKAMVVSPKFPAQR